MEKREVRAREKARERRSEKMVYSVRNHNKDPVRRVRRKYDERWGKSVIKSDRLPGSWERKRRRYSDQTFSIE